MTPLRRASTVFLAGLVAAVAGYAACYFHRTAPQRALLKSGQPELAWLQREFQLTDTEFNRVAALHDAYRPRCEEMCQRIQARKDQLAEALDHQPALTNQADLLLADIAQLRLECHRAMLRHFLEVARAMPEPQGRRYLAWVQSQTLLAEEDMARQHRHH